MEWPQYLSLRDSTLEGLKYLFAEMLATLADTPSKPVVERKLREAFRREEEAIGEQCGRMEDRMKVEEESYLSHFQETINAVTDGVIECLKETRDITAFEHELDQLQKDQVAAVSELARQHQEFLSNWRSELEREVRKSIDKFHEEALEIMTEGILADEATANLDPTKAPKH